MSKHEGIYWTGYDHTYGRRVDVNNAFDCANFILDAVESATKEANSYYQEPFTGRFVGQNTFVVLQLPLEMEPMSQSDEYYGD